MSSLNDFYKQDGIDNVMADDVNVLIANSLRAQYVNAETLTAKRALTDGDTPTQLFTVSSDTIITLPAMNDANHVFAIYNSSSSTASLVIMDSGETEIVAIVTVGEVALVASNKTSWRCINSAKNIATVAKTVTTANVTAVIGELHDCDVSGMTADRDWSLPTPTAIGDLCAVRLVTDAPADYELIIKIDGSEFTRLKWNGESLVFRATGTGAGDWKVAEGGEYRPKFTLSIGDLSLPANTEVELYKLYNLPIGKYIANFTSYTGLDSATIGSGSNIFWRINYSFVINIHSNSNAAIYNSSPSEQIIPTFFCHYRTQAAPTLWLNSDESNGNYGGLTLYIKSSVDCNLATNALSLQRIGD